MIVLLGYAFVGGIVVILSPCILPVLPILLQGSADTGRWKPAGIILGFLASFTVFTLTLSALVSSLGASPDLLRYVAAGILGVLAVVSLVPALMLRFEALAGRLTSRAAVRNQRSGLVGGVLTGVSLGVVWTPCVGPIMASVITLALSSAVTWQAFFVTLAFSLGTAIPMVLIMYGGRGLLNRVQVLKRNGPTIQRIFGALMLLTAVAIGLGLDRRFQSLVLDALPGYGDAIIAVEDNEQVERALPLLQIED